MTARSQNGYPVSRTPGAIRVNKFKRAGVEFPAGLRDGDVTTVLGYVMSQFDARVEKVRAPRGCWGWVFRTNVNAPSVYSNHASGTAVDVNAVDHPNGVTGTFTSKQRDEIHRILREVDGVVRWGGDYTSIRDDMHFEINAPSRDVASVAQKIRNRRKPLDVNGKWNRATKRAVRRELGLNPGTGVLGPKARRLLRRRVGFKGGHTLGRKFWRRFQDRLDVTRTGKRNPETVAELQRNLRKRRLW